MQILYSEGPLHWSSSLNAISLVIPYALCTNNILASFDHALQSSIVHISDCLSD